MEWDYKHSIRQGKRLMETISNRKSVHHNAYIRIPTIITWPSIIEEGSITNHISSTQNFYATILDL